MFDSFGNNVKIKSTPETVELNLNEKMGSVHGETTPSMMKIKVIGSPKEDIAINVHFDELNESFWFDPELLEYQDKGEGVEMTLDGIDEKWTKDGSDHWSEENTVSTEKKWREFWK